MKGLVALPLLAATFAAAPSGLDAGENDTALTKVIELGMSDKRVPTLAALDEFKSVAVPSQFGALENIRWATLWALKPSVYEEIVPIYGYSASDACDSNGNGAADWDWGPAFSALADNLAQDLDPGALYVQINDNIPGGGSAWWYDSLEDACDLSPSYQIVEWVGAERFLRPIAESLVAKDMNVGFVTALPLWNVDVLDEYWAICNTDNLSASADSACRMRLETSPFKRHQTVLAGPLRMNGIGSASGTQPDVEFSPGVP